MKAKLLNAALIICSLFGFLEWGDSTQMFLFQIEAEIISKLFSDPLSVAHPFVVLPLLGQIALLITLFHSKTSRLLTFIGIVGIAVLFLLMLLIGVMGQNFKILASTLPFLALGIYTIIYRAKKG